MLTLQKIIWFLLLPPSSLALIIILGIILIGKWRKLGSVLVVTGIALLYLLSLGPVADALLNPLESGASPLTALPGPADAVVIPADGSFYLKWTGAGFLPKGETDARLETGVELAKKLNIPLIVTGGNGGQSATALSDARILTISVSEMGMPEEQIIMDNNSKNTLENAREVRKLIAGNRIILSTSAYQMMRSAAMFGRAGFKVTPAPSFHLAQTKNTGLALLVPRAANLACSATALSEWLSIAWWGMRGEL